MLGKRDTSILLINTSNHSFMLVSLVTIWSRIGNLRTMVNHGKNKGWKESFRKREGIS